MSQFIVPNSQRSLFGGKTARPPRQNAGALQAAQRSLKYLRDRGWFAEVTERWVEMKGGDTNQKFKGGYRKDLFGFCDVLAFRVEPIEIGGRPISVLAVQTTSRAQMNNHILAYRDVGTFVRLAAREQAEQKRKQHAALQERLLAWMAATGCAFVIHGWEPVSVPLKSKVGDKVVWRVDERIVTATDIQREERF